MNEEKLQENLFHHQGTEWTYNSINIYATLALKSAFLINGLGCSIWLAFSGIIISKGKFLHDEGFFYFEFLLFPISYFSLGLLFIAIAHGILCLSQICYMNSRRFNKIYVANEEKVIKNTDFMKIHCEKINNENNKFFKEQLIKEIEEMVKANHHNIEQNKLLNSLFDIQVKLGNQHRRCAVIIVIASYFIFFIGFNMATFITSIK